MRNPARWLTKRTRKFVGPAAAVLMASAVGVVAAPSALAGSYSIDASGSAMCGLVQFYSNASGFETNCSDSGGGVGAPLAGADNGAAELLEIDSPSTALTITGATAVGAAADFGQGFGGGTYWTGGGASWTGGVEPTSGSIASQYWGIQIVCGDSSGCAATPSGDFPANDGLTGVELTVTENQGPSLVAESGNNLYYQTYKWVWNPPGAPWTIGLTATDPSGVCQLGIEVDGISSAQTAPSDTSTWQQCPSGWSYNPAVDTTDYAPTSGQIALDISATNAAGVTTSANTTIPVDNIQPSVTLTPTNDSNPGGWAVNHSVTLRVAPATGPSGLSSVSCTDTVGGATKVLTLTADSSTTGDYDMTIDGNGAHSVSCTAANNAIDSSGAHNTGTANETVDIDEQPPSLSIEPMDPSNPDQVVVQTSDSESQVESGSIQIAPQGTTNWTALPTTLTSTGQLIATVPDASLRAGAYTVQAGATSLAGNTGTVAEGVTLPLRARTSSAVSFGKIVDHLVAKKVKERVRVGWHWGAKLNKQGKPVKVKVGGYFKTVTVIKRVERCTTKRIRISKHKWKLKETCAKPHVAYEKKATVKFGKKITVYGQLLTSQEVPMAGQTVTIYTAPNNGSRDFTAVGTTTTNADGGWKFKLPKGPSRIVRGSYGGTNTLLPDTGAAHLSVRARIKIAITPRTVAWSKVVTIHGRLEGGYVPHDGVAMRLLIKLPGRKDAYSPVPFRTTSKGTFSVQWSWGTGSGTATYPFWVATTANESDYPYAAAASGHVDVTFNG